MGEINNEIRTLYLREKKETRDLSAVIKTISSAVSFFLCLPGTLRSWIGDKITKRRISLFLERINEQIEALKTDYEKAESRISELRQNPSEISPDDLEQDLNVFVDLKNIIEEKSSIKTKIDGGCLPTIRELVNLESRITEAQEFLTDFLLRY